MRHSPRLGVAVALAITGACLLWVPAASAEECQPLLDRFNHAIDSGAESQAQTLVDQISTSADCGRYQVATQRRLAALRLKLAQGMMARGRPVADFDRLLLAAQAPEVLWQASATVGS